MVPHALHAPGFHSPPKDGRGHLQSLATESHRCVVWMCEVSTHFCPLHHRVNEKLRKPDEEIVISRKNPKP